MPFNRTSFSVFRQPLFSAPFLRHSATSVVQSRRLLGLFVGCVVALTLAWPTDTHRLTKNARPSTLPVAPEDLLQPTVLADRPAAPLSQRVQAERAALEERKRVLSARISGRYRVSPIVARKIVDSAHLAGQRHQVDPLLLLAISAVESSFNPQAVSSAGAVGLIQAMPTAHPEKFARLKASGKSPFDAAVSLDLGGQIYAEYWRRLGGDRVLALQQYNGSLKDPKRRYSNKVLAAYAFLADGLPKAPPPA